MPDTRCRSCEAAIRWVKTEHGKNMPVDAAPEKLLLEVSDGVFGVRTVYRSHFQTCPNAAQHRKERG